MTANLHEGTDIQSIVLHPDGFAWEAIVGVRSAVYVARYVGGRLSVEPAPGAGRSRARRWHVEVVREWSLANIVHLPREWHRRHETMHGIRRERDAIRHAARACIKASGLSGGVTIAPDGRA